MDYSSDDLTDQSSFNQPRSVVKKSLNFRSLILAGFSIALIIFFLPSLTSRCLPLLKPIGASMLQRLWEVLRFIVVTTAISVGILNSQRKTMERSDNREEQDRYSRSGSRNIGASFTQTDQQPKGNSEVVASEPAGSFHVQAASFRDIAASYVESSRSSTHLLNIAEISVEAPSQEEVPAAEKLRTSARSTDTRVPTDGSGGNTSVQQKGKTDSSDTDWGDSSAAATRSSRKARPFASDQELAPKEDLTTVTKIHHSRSASVSQARPTIDRENSGHDMDGNGKTRKRSSSLERPIQQQSTKSSSANVQNPASTTVSNVSRASRQASNPTTSKVSTTRIQISNTAVSNVSSTSVRASNTTTSKVIFKATVKEQPESNVRGNDAHNKLIRQSRSAVNLEQLNNSKSSRRNTSLSYDFGDDYNPQWLYSEPPSPPLPPATVWPESENEGASPNPKTTLKKAFSVQSLVPWRSSPIDISRGAIPNVSHPSEILASPAHNISPSPGASPAHNISPSPGELNKKVDAFIARFHEQMRIQRLESFRRRLEEGG